jgi:hypothetical protein
MFPSQHFARFGEVRREIGMCIPGADTRGLRGSTEAKEKEAERIRKNIKRTIVMVSSGKVSKAL